MKQIFFKILLNFITFILIFALLLNVPAISFLQNLTPKVNLSPNLAYATGINPLPSVNGDIAGSIPGEFSVNEIGAATYHVPLSVPPGTASVVPQISLDYSSAIGGGHAGMG